MAYVVLGRGRASPLSTFTFPTCEGDIGTGADKEGKQEAVEKNHISFHRRLFERKSTDQQRQKQASRRGSSSSKSQSQNNISKYLRGRLTPDDDGAFGRRSLDSFAERLRRKQQKQPPPPPQQQQQQQEPQTQKQTVGQSLGLPIMSNAAMSYSEFEALPDAVQRKYFTSVERLRFAQESVTDLDHADPLRSCPVNLSPSTSSFHSTASSCPPTPRSRSDSKPTTRHARLASDFVTHGIAPDSFFRPGAITPDFYVHLPEKIQRRHLTSEEQDIVVKHRRKRFVPDPSDELAYEKLLSRLDGLDLDGAVSSPVSLRRFDADLDLPRRPRSAGTMTTRKSGPILDGDRPSRNSIYDSFRWLDEDEELDLRLYLDDYHANLRNELPLDSKARRPSFRRNLSVSRLPFGLAPNFAIQVPPHEMSALSPTSDTFASPLSSPSLPPSPQPASAPTLSPAPQPGQSRKSRTLSLITPKHLYQEPLLDGPAAHYQDPNARLKLREYLASAQKFDEAIEFGFPSTDVPPGTEKHQEDGVQTFLADDKSSVYSDDAASEAEPDSPTTPVVEEDPTKPLTFTKHTRSSTEPFVTDLTNGPSSREMTLRMTLTRPDLRADEQQIYGWQKTATPPRKSQSLAVRDNMPPSLSAAEIAARESIQRKLDAIDMECQADERGVIRRIWKKVRRHQ